MADRTDPIVHERVLFEIEAEPNVVSTKPFADIHRISHFADEFEVLFMVGSIFRLNSIVQDDNKIWIISMSLCSDEEHDLKDVLAHMKKQVGTGNTNLWTLGKLLRTMGKFDLAEQYYCRLLQEVRPNDLSIASLYVDLAEIASLQGNFDKSVNWHKKSLEIKKQHVSYSLEGTLDFLQIPNQNLQLHESIGDGAFGTVYRATWLPRNHIVAVKKLHLIHWNQKAKMDFFKELSFIDILRSPYIINFYGACIETDKFSLVMEYMSLGSLYKILHTEKLFLDWSDRLSIALQAAKGINYLHKLQPSILHRDIKSSNFLLARSNSGFIVKVSDFGLAQTRSETTRQTQFNYAFFGTIQWTAPEIFNLQTYTDKSDVYSLGIVYWELATNKIPYDGHKNCVVREFVLASERLKIPETTPSNFSSLIKKCWAHNPDHRPDCSRVVQLIEECISKPSLADASWSQNGVTVAGGNGRGSDTNNLYWPHDFFVDDDQTIVIADWGNDRIVQWKKGDMDGQVVAGGNGLGNRLDQLKCPTGVLIDKETDSLIICDRGNTRVVRWSRSKYTTQGEILIDNIACFGLAMDEQRNLYVSDTREDSVRRYKIGDKKGTLVAGGHGQGVALNQLNWPTCIFVDQQQTVYVSDFSNHRIMKWNRDATEGIIIAGGQGKDNVAIELNHPQGLFVDTSGTIYVVDSRNNRVLRWFKDTKQGTVIVGGYGLGKRANQFNSPVSLSFDCHNNLYIVDCNNHRVQRFSMD